MNPYCVIINLLPLSSKFTIAAHSVETGMSPSNTFHLMVGVMLGFVNGGAPGAWQEE